MRPAQVADAQVADTRVADGGPAVLVTRPEPGASETAARLAGMGFRPVLAPVLHIAPRPLRDPGGAQAVLVTSGSALAALPAALHGTRLIAVGDTTAARARAAGFTAVLSAGRDAASLAELVARSCAPASGPLLLASGAGQGLALAADLRARGFRVRRRVAYAAAPVAALPEAARSALDAGALDAALFFSPATARVFMTLLHHHSRPDAVRGMAAYALSPATEAALRPLPWRCIRVASHPTQDEMLALLT